MTEATYLPDIACSARMVNLLKQYGAAENPYEHETNEWDREAQRMKDSRA